MATGFNSKVDYLISVMDQFGSERGKYSEFFQIFMDFVNKVDGDEIIRRTKELFNGDERMVTEFYNLLLDTKRKKKKPDDFWEAFNCVGKNMMQKNHDSHAKESDSEQTTLQGHVEMDSTEDSNMCTRYNCSTQPDGERGDNFASSIDNEINHTKFLQAEEHTDKFVKTDTRDRLGEQNIDGKKKRKCHKRARYKRNGSLGEELPSNPSDTRPQEHNFVTDKESDTANNCQSPDEDLPISVLAGQSDYHSCTPSYRLLPEKVGDLGLSKVKCHTLISGGVRGTLPWMAPELLNGSSSLVSEKVDVFSFGIVMWELLTGEEPYADLHYGTIIGGIVSNTLRPPVPEFCDPEWRALMEKCWSADPSERPSFADIAERLRSVAASIQKKGQAQTQVQK